MKREPTTARRNVLLTTKEDNDIVAAALKAGLTVAVFIRMAALKEARAGK